MDAIFVKLFNMSAAAGWLIFTVIVLRLLFKKAPKWLICTLWAIVAIRLVCPFYLESSFSLIPNTETFNPSHTQKPAIDNEIPFLNNALNLVTGTPSAPDSLSGINSQQSWMPFFGTIWGIGCLCLLGYAFISSLRIRHKVRESVPLRDNIRLCDAVKSPFILGIFRPQIYLSSSAKDDKQTQYILAHEQAHLARGDHLWKPLSYLLLAVHWFHPLVWVAYFLFCRDVELACDEKVIKNMNMTDKKAYSNALVSCSIQRKMVMAYPLAFGEIGVKERVKNVLNYKKPAFWVIGAGIVACILAAICFLTNPKMNAFDIKIVIPAHSESAYYYSDEEISSDSKKVTLLSGQGLGDTIVILKPTGPVTKAPSSTYLTPGMSVKMDAEKGAWYQVGVNMSNPTDEDIVVYVRAEGVTVRIDSYASTLENQADQTNDATSLALLSEAQVYTQNPTENSPDTITFIGTIVENTIDTLTPQILVETMGQEIPYEYVWFELPGDEADWGTKINAVVSITCTGQFSEIEMDSFDSKLVYGTLLSITRVGSQPIIIPSASPAMESQRPEEDKPQRDHCYP